jgi:hypothetical protein
VETIDSGLKMKKQVLKWMVVSALFWTAIALIFAFPHLGQQRDKPAFILAALAQWWAWGIVAPAIFAIDYFVPISDRRIRSRVAFHAGMGPVIAVLCFYLAAMLNVAIGGETWHGITTRQFIRTAYMEICSGVMTYALMIGLWQAFLYRQRLAESNLLTMTLQKSISDAHLNILRMQLDPHFLFNSLNTISSQIRRNPTIARKMVGHLGDLLRLSLDSRGVQEIPLNEELAFLDHYLAIQRVRFDDKLSIRIDVDERLAHALVPSMFIQPLVENAIRHGISKKIQGGSIFLTITLRHDTICFTLLDDGVGLSTNWSMDAQQGIGLTVTRQRFARLYTEAGFDFAVSDRPEGGTSVSLRFPLRIRSKV